MNTTNENNHLSLYKNESMDLFETIKDIQEARDLLAKIQNEPEVVCERYWIEKDDLVLVEEELTNRINAIEENDVKNYCEWKLKIINELTSRIVWMKSEVERLESLIEKTEKTKEKAVKSVDWILKATGTEKLDTSLNSLSYRKSESVSVLDEALIPEEYWKEKVTKTIDKVWIKEAIKSWKDVAGASIQTNMNLQIK